MITAVVTAALACGSVAPVSAPASSPPDVVPTAGVETQVSRDDAVLEALFESQDLFDNLQSLGRISTTVQALLMTAARLEGLVDGASTPGGGTTPNGRIWAVQVNIEMVGTPGGSGKSYALVSVDATDGDAVLLGVFDRPVIGVGVE